MELLPAPERSPALWSSSTRSPSPPLPPVAGRLFPVMSPSHSFLSSSNDTVLPFLLGKSYTKVDLMDPEHDGVWGGREADPIHPHPTSWQMGI